ncbi:MAG: M18 family aminopeptidase [Clostridia bacterium]|nr:M18 family aminopeptidase [Clostridia bacterium]
MNQKLFDYIKASPTAYHAVAHTAEVLAENGYTHLCESDPWTLEAGRGYYVTRNGSSLIAFRVPTANFRGFMIAASHSDSPAFKIKENAELKDKNYVRLSVEKYGGMLCSTWLDRPLSIAGRVLIRTEEGVRALLCDLREPCALIPNVAIHMNRNANDGASFNAAVDMLPLYATGNEETTLRTRIAASLGVAEADILTTDLFLYNPQSGIEWNGLISSPRLDDLQCAFCSLTGFLAAAPSSSAPVYALFDNEEVGSGTKQGAASTLLSDVLSRISEAFATSSEAYPRRVANSFMLSCDNAHGIHPNHPEHADRNHTSTLGGGVVIKYNANQRYTSDGVSAAIFRLMCEEAGVPVQMYANRADMPGGSTLGNIAQTQVSLNTVDIGLAQLAMHSSYETASAADTESMVKALTAFYGKSLKMEADGLYRLK